MIDPRLTRIEPLPPKGLRVRVHLDVGEPFEVALEAIELSRLGVGDLLTSKERERLLDLDADVRVRDAALALISHRARTRKELRGKLRQKGFAASRIDACLARLEEKGLVSDAAVAAAFVRDRLRFRPRGRPRLVSELRAKGVDPDLAHESIATVFEDEGVDDANLARDAAEAWLDRQSAAIASALGSRTRSADGEKAKRRLYGYLVRRGFRGDALNAALVHAEEQAEARSRT